MSAVFKSLTRSVTDSVTYVISHGAADSSDEELLGLFKEALEQCDVGRVQISLDGGKFAFKVPELENFRGFSVPVNTVRDLIALKASGVGSDLPLINFIGKDLSSQEESRP